MAASTGFRRRGRGSLRRRVEVVRLEVQVRRSPLIVWPCLVRTWAAGRNGGSCRPSEPGNLGTGAARCIMMRVERSSRRRSACNSPLERRACLWSTWRLVLIELGLWSLGCCFDRIRNISSRAGWRLIVSRADGFLERARRSRAGAGSYGSECWNGGWLRRRRRYLRYQVLPRRMHLDIIFCSELVGRL